MPILRAISGSGDESDGAASASGRSSAGSHCSDDSGNSSHKRRAFSPIKWEDNKEGKQQCFAIMCAGVKIVFSRTTNFAPLVVGRTITKS